MSAHAVLPYRFPTTVAVVDDNADFLANFSLELDADLAYRLFDSPREALKDLQGDRRAQPLHQRCFVPHREAVGYPARDHYMRLDVSALEAEAENPRRFDEVSVVLVDYAMPGMNGLEFCEYLTSPAVKKILFTGVGDEKVAVSAFNSGLIDRFVRKQERNVADTINATIAELQERYFQEVAQMIQRSLRGGDAPFLEDPAFGEYFRDLRREKGIVEHYFVGEPAGFLMLTPSGRPLRLVVMDDEDMQAQWEIARDQDAPQGLLAALEYRRGVPYFWRSGGYYRPNVQDWESHLLPARTVFGDRRYYVACVEEPEAYDHLRERIHSYNSYLEALDASNGLPGI